MGQSITVVKDVDGDGKDDLVIGDKSNNGNGYESRAYVVKGGSVMPSTIGTASLAAGDVYYYGLNYDGVQVRTDKRLNHFNLMVANINDTK
jgi:hypothetical protein